ncbi:hypothetical protein MF636_003857 [Salmonella enterica subsp. enterica serovar Typhimurium]|nr:hypothetical protein [Salmonella enterica subsp. enterica serovar Typhimurium]
MSNDIHNKIADALASVGLKLSDGYTRAALLLKMKGSVSLNFAVDGKPVTVTLHMTESGDVTATTDYDDSTATAAAAAAATTTPTQESVEKPAEESVEEPEKSNTRKGPRPKEGANKQVISSQADSLIKISRIWADFFPANTSNQPI